MSEDRRSEAEPVELISDPDEKARREAENGIRQFKAAVKIISDYVSDPDRKFRLKQSLILELHQKTLEGIHPQAGTYRNSAVRIGSSSHTPPPHIEVPDHVVDMCAYVDEHWNVRSAIQLAAYVLWRMNWIHPFADGNGRTARVVSYVVLSIKLRSLLPGTPTIPDQIAADKKPYYDELEHADAAWKHERLHLSGMEQMLERMLAKQLLRATEEATNQL
jgi:Fic family protein